MSRHAARIAAMRAVYAMQFSNIQDMSRNQIFDELDLEQDDVQYFEEVLAGTELHKQEIDKHIENNINNWKMDRLPKVDLAVLRIAVYELLHRSDVPEGVTINEAVRIAKTHSTAKSGRYVNGVLSSINKEIEKNCP